MTCRQPYLDENEIFGLLYNPDKNEDLNDESGDKFDYSGQMSSKHEEDAVVENCEDDVDFIKRY